MINARGRSFALPAFTAVLMVMGPAGTALAVDSAAPNKPVVSSTDYPTGGFHGSPGRTGIFTFSPGDSTDVARYGWSLNVDTYVNQVAANGPVDVPITPSLSGTNSLYVRSYDEAGTPSDRQIYVFTVADLSRPVAAWNLDETGGTTAADITGHGHTLTLNGATFDAGYSNNGQVTVGGSFSATSDAVVDSSRAFSVSAWVKLDDAETGYTIASQDNGFALGHGDGRWSFGTASSTTAPRAGEWTHLLGTYEPNQVSLYVNGKLEGAAAATLTNASGPFVLGSGQATATIDHVQVWDRALSAAEAVKHNNFVVPRARYLFDEREGVTAKDEVSGQNGTLSDGVTWAGTPVDPDDPNQILTSKDKWARFDSSGQVTGPRPANLRTDRSFTVSAWVRSSDLGDTAETVLGMSDAPFVLGYQPAIHRWSFQLGEAVVLSDFPAANEWVHLAATYDATSGTVVFYVDGTRQAEGLTGVQSFNGTGDLVVGGGVTGAIDDPRVFSGVMTLGDVEDVRLSSKHR